MFREGTSEQDEETPQRFTMEKQTRGRDLQQAKRLDELKIAETENAQRQSELLCMRRHVDDLSARLNEAMNASMKDRLRADRMERASFTSKEDWKAELEAMEKHYQVEISHLQNANEVLKYEVVEANKAKESALRMSRDAMLAGEVTKKQLEAHSVELEKAMAAVSVSRLETLECRRLLDELTKKKTDLSEAYAACQTSAQAGAAIVGEKEAELRKQSAALFQAKQEAELLRWELFESRKNEARLYEMSNELELLKKILAIAKQTEQEQAKVVMDTNAKLQEAHLEVQLARAAMNQVATSLTSLQGELQEIRTKWMLASAEVTALTENVESMKIELETQQVQMRLLQERDAESEAKLVEASENLAGFRTKWMLASAEVTALTENVESMKSELVTQQMQMRVLQERDAESEAKLVEASENLAGFRAREQHKDERLHDLARSLEEARFESQLLRQQLYEAVFEAQFRFDEAVSESEVELTKDLFSLHIVLKSAVCLASNARADLQKVLNELCSERALDDSAKNSSMDCASAVTKDSPETIEVDALLHDPCSLEVVLAVCKPAALSITCDLKVIREQIDRIREEAEMLVAVTSESNCYKQEDDKAQVSMSAARLVTLAEQDQGNVEVVTVNFDQFQQNCDGRNPSKAKEEAQGKFRELLELWEMVDSGSEATVTIKKEEYDFMKLKVHEAMESKSVTEAQSLSLGSSNQRLLSQLDATKLEIKALRSSEQSMFQQYDRLQQQNIVLEAEMQRLKGKGEHLLKSWEAGHEACGLDANTLHCPQPMLDMKLQQASLPHSICRNMSSPEKEDDSTEFLSLSTNKKKKKALYLRIGTFLTKKMN